jgi:hypothetical protein
MRGLNLATASRIALLTAFLIEVFQTQCIELNYSSVAFGPLI